MAANKAIERAVSVSFPVPTTISSGDPVMVGDIPGVAETTEADGVATISMEGAYFLSVLASDGISPISGVALKPGDPVYADGGSTDSTTNITSGFTLDADDSKPLFGYVLDGVTSGATATVRVKLHQA